MFATISTTSIVVVVGFALLAVPGTAQTLVDPPCGSVISQGETAILTQDLICTNHSPNIILIGGTFDMGGHTLECADFDRGIDIYGTGSRLFNGTVTGCSFGVLTVPFVGNGGHDIHHINSSGNFAGFSILTNDTILRSVTANHNVSGVVIGASETEVGGNRLIASNIMHNGACGVEVGINAEATEIRRNTMSENGHQGLCDFGSGSIVIANSADGNSLHGFQYGGPNAISDRGAYRSNRAIGNRHNGFLISGVGGTFVANLASDNSRNGFLVDADVNGNTLQANRAFNNGDGQTTFDLSDGAGDCADNTYKANRFGTGPDCMQ